MLGCSPATAVLHVAFRYDDLAADAPGTRQKDPLRDEIWRAENQIDGLFKASGLSYTVAIVPRPQGYAHDGVQVGRASFCADVDPEKVEFIRRGVREGRIEVAQHGYAHANHVRPGHRPAEFRERDYRAQFDDIRQGRGTLLNACGSSDIKVFVPPWNAWSQDTATALKNLGFTVLSADRYYCYETAKGLTLLPFTTTLSEIESCLAQDLLPTDGIVVVLYHEFDLARFPGQEGLYFGPDRFGTLLTQLSTKPGVEIVTLSQLADKAKDVTFPRYREASLLWRQRSFWAKILPARLWPGESNRLFYLEADAYGAAVTRWRGLAGLFAVALFAAGWVVGRLFRAVRLNRWLYVMALGCIVVIAVCVMAEVSLVRRGYHMTAIRLLPAIPAAGLLCSVLLAPKTWITWLRNRCATQPQ